jgi:hypothetical protein
MAAKDLIPGFQSLPHTLAALVAFLFSVVHAARQIDYLQPGAGAGGGGGRGSKHGVSIFVSINSQSLAFWG